MFFVLSFEKHFIWYLFFKNWVFVVKKINVFGMFSKLNIVKQFWPKKNIIILPLSIYIQKKNYVLPEPI
jgi:hypothetical protein